MMTDEDAALKFNSDLGKALIYIKNMGKPDKIEQLSTDERFRLLKTDTVLMLNEIMNADFQVQRKKPPPVNKIAKALEMACFRAFFVLFTEKPLEHNQNRKGDD